MDAPIARTSTRRGAPVAAVDAGLGGAAPWGDAGTPPHSATILGTSWARTASIEAVTLPTFAGLVT